MTPGMCPGGCQQVRLSPSISRPSSAAAAPQSQAGPLLTLPSQGPRPGLCLRGVHRRQSRPSCLPRFDSAFSPGLAIERLSKHPTRQRSPNLLKPAQLGPWGCLCKAEPLHPASSSSSSSPPPPPLLRGRKGLGCADHGAHTGQGAAGGVTASGHPSAPAEPANPAARRSCDPARFPDFRRSCQLLSRSPELHLL